MMIITIIKGHTSVYSLHKCKYGRNNTTNTTCSLVSFPYFNPSASVWLWAGPEAEVGWHPQSLGWVLGRWGAVRAGRALQPAAPSEHSSLCLSAWQYQLLWHLRGYRRRKVSACCIQDECAEIVLVDEVSRDGNREKGVIGKLNEWK